MCVLALSVSIGHHFFRVIPIVGLCLWAGSYDQNWQFMGVNAYILLWKQHTIGVSKIAVAISM